jgi:hypothetical protein
MVNIDLGRADLDLLHTALQRHLLVLREELVRTDDRQYRQSLREDVSRLEALFGRLEELRRTDDSPTAPNSH